MIGHWCGINIAFYPRQKKKVITPLCDVVNTKVVLNFSASISIYVYNLNYIVKIEMYVRNIKTF